MFRKLLIPIIILIIVAVLIIGYYYPNLFFGIGSKTKEKTELTEKQINSKRISALVSSLDFYSSSDIIALLSVKYSMSSETLINVLSDYDSQAKPDYDFENFSLAEIKSNMKNDVGNMTAGLNSLAKNYDIQPATLVNILIDYKLLKNADK